MPKTRQPHSVWRETRRQAWERDSHRCVRCGKLLTLYEAHIDHIQSGKLGTNKLSNLRTLCRVDHALRADQRHRGLIRQLLKRNELPATWRKLVWEDNELTDGCP